MLYSDLVEKKYLIGASLFFIAGLLGMIKLYLVWGVKNPVWGFIIEDVNKSFICHGFMLMLTLGSMVFCMDRGE